MADRAFAEPIQVCERVTFELDVSTISVSTATFDYFALLAGDFERFSLGRSFLPNDLSILTMPASFTAARTIPPTIS